MLRLYIRNSILTNSKCLHGSSRHWSVRTVILALSRGVLLSRNVSIPYLLRQFGGAKASRGLKDLSANVNWQIFHDLRACRMVHMFSVEHKHNEQRQETLKFCRCEGRSATEESSYSWNWQRSTRGRTSLQKKLFWKIQYSRCLLLFTQRKFAKLTESYRIYLLDATPFDFLKVMQMSYDILGEDIGRLSEMQHFNTFHAFWVVT